MAPARDKEDLTENGRKFLIGSGNEEKIKATTQKRGNNR